MGIQRLKKNIRKLINMRPLWEFQVLKKHIRNWFRYKYPTKNNKVRYVTKGRQLKFDVSRPYFGVFQEIFVYDFYRIDKLVPNIRPGGVVLDVGANAGYFTFLLLSKLKDLKVYAFEPISSNLNIFKNNIALNSGLENQINLYGQAVTGNNTGTMEIFYDAKDHNPIVASVYEDFSDDNNDIQKVDAISLNEFILINNISSIDLLKLDCEGSEYPILFDSPDSVWPIIKGMAIEAHNLDNDKRNVDYLIKFLTAKNYYIEKEMAPNGCYSLTAFNRD